MALQGTPAHTAAAGSNPGTHDHTQAAGSSRVVVCISQGETESDEAPTISAISYGGTSILANAVTIARGTNGGGNSCFSGAHLALEALMASLGDGTRTISSTISTVGALQGFTVGGAQFSGRAQSVPSNTVQVNGSETVSWTVAADDDLVMVVTNNTAASDVGPPSGYTQQWDSAPGGDTRNFMATYAGVGAGARTDTWTPSGTGRPATNALALSAAGAATSILRQMMMQHH